MRNLFNIARRVEVQPAPVTGDISFDVTGTETPSPTTTVQREGVFVTPQSLASFAGATGAVTIVWQTVGAIRPGWGNDPAVGAVISIIVGVIVYLISETDPDRGPVKVRDRIIGLLIALLNTCVLFSAAVGAVDVASGGRT